MGLCQASGQCETFAFHANFVKRMLRFVSGPEACVGNVTGPSATRSDSRGYRVQATPSTTGVSSLAAGSPEVISCAIPSEPVIESGAPERALQAVRI